MDYLPDEAQQVITRVRDTGIAYLDLQFTDVTGIIKTVQIPARQVEVAFKQGIWFDGSAIEGKESCDRQKKATADRQRSDHTRCVDGRNSPNTTRPNLDIRNEH